MVVLDGALPEMRVLRVLRDACAARAAIAIVV